MRARLFRRILSASSSIGERAAITSPADVPQDRLRAEQLRLEQAAVDGMYARLDELRDHIRRALTEVRAAGASGTPQARSERDAFARLYEDRLAALEAAEDRLCFGRIDLDDGASHHVGRLGLSDDDQRQLLVDWRAPAAQPFYQATAVDTRGAVLRRHLTTVGREVTHLEDDVLDLDAARRADLPVVSGEGALLASLSAARTGRMGDIVATIQSEQDRIIRSDLAGVLVVQGGPGTGKTAVALHRAAYLLYTHRERLERSGVLLVGPSPVFLRYIDQVLPSLGETGVVTTTMGTLLPGIRTGRHDPPAVARVKGDLRMAGVLDAAVRAYERVPERALELSVRGVRLRLRPGTIAHARNAARGHGRSHNAGRRRFLLTLMDELARQLARGLQVDFDSDARRTMLDELRDDRAVRRELNLLWLPLEPGRVLRALYAEPDRLRAATLDWSETDRALLRRGVEEGWTVEDVPLLDELAELIGEDDASAATTDGPGSADLEHARRVLEMGSVASGMMTAQAFAERWAETGPVLSVAERAADDRAWQFGHVIVDEAQELSPMAWRSLFRRCSRRSMTIVGDLAQAGAGLERRTWEEILAPHLPAGSWRTEELSITYRTPGLIMRTAARVLAASGSPLTAPVSVREGTWAPSAVAVSALDADVLAPVVREEVELLEGGRTAVVLPRSGAASADEVARALGERLGVGVAAGASALDQPVAVLGVEEVKGLEFDSVVLWEPASMLDGESGWGDLYVALTRPTQRLTVLHRRPLPAPLQSLDPRPHGSPREPAAPRAASA